MSEGDGRLELVDSMTRSTRRERRLRWAIVLNVVIVGLQVVFGMVAHSLGLLADAGHNLTDVAAVAISLVAVRWARREPTSRRSFGYHRGTVLAAVANAASILVVTLLIAVEAIRRIADPVPVTGGLVIVVALTAAAVNAVAALALHEGHGGHDHSGGSIPSSERDLNMRSAVLHMVGDSLASVGVASAGLVIVVTGGFYWLDPAVSLGIGFLIAVQAWRLLREAGDVLLESTPDDLDVATLASTMIGVDGVEEVHDLHAWSLSSDLRALSAHIVLSGHPTLEEAQGVGAHVKSVIGARFGITHATLELECEACEDGTPRCPMDPSTPPPASPGHEHG